MNNTDMLSDIEFAILERVTKANGCVVLSTDLIRAAYGNELGATRHALRQRVHVLNRKLGRRVVASSYGYGYRLNL